MSEKSMDEELDWEYRFPELARMPAVPEQTVKVVEEAVEAQRSVFDRTFEAAAVEAMDVIHAAETLLRLLEEKFGADLDWRDAPGCRGYEVSDGGARMTRYPCDMAPVLAALGYETRVCPECGKPFTEPRFRHGNGRFCSPACRIVNYSKKYYGKKEEAQ